MHSTTSAPCACDPVAAAVEDQLRELHADEYGELNVDEEPDGVRLTFANAEVRAETYDIALVRLAGALLNDPYCGKALISRLRRSVTLAHI